MLKKVPIHNPSDLSCVQNRNNCCSMCKPTGKSIFYVCTSGHHVICNNCQYDALKDTNDDGDCVPEKEFVPNNKKELLYSHSGIIRRDMSSRDHSRCVGPYKNIAVSNNKIIMDNLLPTSMAKRCLKCEPETRVIYKNEKFHDDRSNITWDNVSPMYKTTEKLNHENISRPVVCPIASCGKIVTIDSFSQHFNFDHSKIPKMIMNKSAKQEILINYTALSEETKCVATFVILHGKRSNTALRRITSHTNITNCNKDSELLLLMVVKMKATPTKFCIHKCSSNITANRSYAVIDGISKRNMQDQSSISKSQSENKIHVNKDDNEVILLWLCRLKDKTKIYTINVSREDNQLGYSYIGEAVHIRNEQDPISIYNSTECLSLRGTVIKKLVTPENELKVIVSTEQ